jgi:hypothetical protein
MLLCNRAGPQEDGLTMAHVLVYQHPLDRCNEWDCKTRTTDNGRILLPVEKFLSSSRGLTAIPSQARYVKGCITGFSWYFVHHEAV